MSDYDTMLEDHPKPWCWACINTHSFYDKPDWWFAPWLIERAHIVNKPRAKDRRACILLCSLCHKLSHGEKFARHDGPQVPLTLPQMLWLKRMNDRKFYDREFLQRHHLGKLPNAQKFLFRWHSS
jgi:hypothetical protein